MHNNTEVQDAVLEAQNTFELLADAQAVQVPTHLKSEIFAQLDFAKSKVVSTDTVVEKQVNAPIRPLHEKSDSGNFSKYGMIAASILLLLSLVYNFYTDQEQKAEVSQLATNNNQLKTQVLDLENQNSMMLNSRNIKLEGVEQHPGMLADIFWHTSKKVFLKIDNLPTAPQGKQYQLWAIVDGKPVDAGMFDGNQPEKIQEMKVIDNAQAFAITLENKGGSPSPTMEEMYVMGTT